MPRRPRPSHRVPPRSTKTQLKATEERSLKKGVEEQSDEFESEGSLAAGSDDENSLDLSDEDAHADGPRASQWAGEDELEEWSEEESEEEKRSEAGPSQLKKLETNLSNLPFGALKSAQYALSHADNATDSETGDNESNDSASENEGDPPVSRSGHGVEWSIKPRKDIAKRSNKHAPIEMTSKKPVTRFRQVTEVKKLESRDPRFLPTAGEFRAEKFQQNYQFLTEAHGNELSMLRESLKRARKMLDNAPRYLRDGYEAEVQRLELAAKRAESVVNKERMDKIQREALLKVSKEEKDKRKQGKGKWFLKKSEKREVITRARYDALAAEGGKRAVKKAIEKKQKRIGQREKKSRPFPKDSFTGEDSRKRGASREYDTRKRRKVG